MKVWVKCHMLSTAAQNAFLKVLEEPPAHVIFVLATTDPQKILPTIISRVQRFELKRITVHDIYARLAYICETEGIELDDDAQETLEYIARSVDGGMRDAIKLLQKCSSLDEVITRKTVIDALGSVDPKTVETVTTLLLNSDAQGVLNYFNELVSGGVDIRILLTDIIEYLTESMKESLIQKDYNIGRKMDIATELTEFLATLRNATQLKILTELKFMRMCTAGFPKVDPVVISGGIPIPPIQPILSIPVQPLVTEKVLNVDPQVVIDPNDVAAMAKALELKMDQKIKEQLDVVYMQIDAIRFKK